ncbi:tannase/feruloyl esterase family alpha/beta hydrolase [Streptomyces sp. NPDC058613]|uniref:tannase/feruloyl esterase family alpha/beta hydrolase n=1 Tax=Streptomyces sp. NPDC058613 TaxID=3346556 RepID=UPI003668A928
MRIVRPLGVMTALLLTATLGSTAASAVPAESASGEGANGAGCTVPRVPGAEKVIGACLTDLTTAGTVGSGHTDPADWAGLVAPGTVNPSGVKGLQLDGYFPDTSTTNTNHGWNHDSQFVIRLPERWNGGLVVAGPPGVREQYANDRIIGDHALARGFAYAATDKGNTGPLIHRDGIRPGDAVAEWHTRLTQLTVAAKQTAARHYGHKPARTYVAGTSAAGYLVRWQLENRPGLYTGGIDWSGLLITRDAPNILDTAPAALRAYPRYRAGEPGAREAMHEAGYPAGSEPLWEFHHRSAWDALQRTLREEVDPGYDGAKEAGTPFCPEGTGAGCDTDYVYADRPATVHDTVERLSLTGKLKRPLITLHGTLDVLLPITRSGDTYADMVDESGRHAKSLHRYYRITAGTHTDGLHGSHPGLVRPMLPCFNAAFDAMTAWTTQGVTPPSSRTVPAPPAGSDPVEDCTL